MYTIYGLADPRTGLIRYVGQTKLHPSARLEGHLQDAENGRKREWILELKALGIRPIPIVLEYAETLERSLAIESYWIHQGKRSGWDLLNSVYQNGKFAKVRRRQRQKLPVAIKASDSELESAQRWKGIVDAWFAAHPAALTGPALGISDLARAMCIDAEGDATNYEAYKGRAHRLFHDFRASVRLATGDRLGTDISTMGD